MCIINYVYIIHKVYINNIIYNIHVPALNHTRKWKCQYMGDWGEGAVLVEYG